MSVTPLTAEEITAMLAKPGRGMIGKGKSVHLTRNTDLTYCGKIVDTSVQPYEGETLCKRCYAKVESNYRYERKIAYGVMRDEELDRMTYGGQPFTKEEETAAIDDAMQYAGRTTNADIAILTADGFVECTPEILESALTELVKPEIQVMRELFPEYSDETIREILDRPEFSTPNKDDYADPDAFESGIRNANDTAREVGFEINSPEWLECFQRSYEMMRVENEDRRINAEFEAEQDAELAAFDAEYERQQYINYETPEMVEAHNNGDHSQCEHERGMEEWHVFSMGEWHSMEYDGYAPVNILIDGTYREIEYRHLAGDCNNACVLGDESGPWIDPECGCERFANPAEVPCPDHASVMREDAYDSETYAFSAVPQDGLSENEPMVDTMTEPMTVDALLSIEVDGVRISLGWNTFYVSPRNEKSIQQMYGELHGEWKRPGVADWDSVIFIDDSETY